MKQVRRSDLLYPELSYQIVGSAFDVYDTLGPGHHEKVYERALAQAFSDKGILFSEQVYGPVKFREKVAGKQYFDFVVDDKIVVELKKGNRYSKAHIDQIKAYLVTQGLSLGLIINFADDTVDIRRVLNIHS